MRANLRVFLVVLIVASILVLTSLAFAKTSVIAVYFPSIAACYNDGGGWFVTVTGDDGVSNTYLYCDGGPLP